jgi:hypothetical protein
MIETHQSIDREGKRREMLKLSEILDLCILPTDKRFPAFAPLLHGIIANNTNLLSLFTLWIQ